MNKIFKVVWSKTKECYVVVSEVAKNNGGKKKVLASVLAGLAMVGVGAAGTPVQAVFSDSGSSINVYPNAKTGNYVGSNAVVVGFENRTDADIPGTDQLGRVIYGTGNIGAGNSALAVGNNNEARGTAVVAIGHGANAKAKQSVALGNVARAEKDGTVAIGTYVNAETTNVGTATVPKYNTKETGAYSTAVGAFSWTKGDYSAAYGYQAEATGTNAVAIGRVSKATGTSATAVGVNNKAQAQDSTAVGSSNTIDDIATQSSAFGRENTVNRDGSIAAGYKNTAVGQRNVAIGNQNTTAGEETIGIGTKVIAGTGKTIAIGGVYNPGGGVEKQTIARGNDTINAATGQVNNIFALAIGNGAQADGKAKSASGMIAIGQDVTADNNNTVAIGVQTKATGNNALAVGSTAQAIGTSSAAFGTQAVANGTGATAFGPGSSAGTGAVTADGSVAVGRKATVTAAGGVGIGWTASASEKNATAIGFSATASGVQSVAIGGGDEYDYPGTERGKHFTTASGKSSVAVGSYAKATEENAMAFGTNANANIAGGVALGSESKTTTAAGIQGYNPASDRTNKYSTQGGAVGTSTLAAVSIGDGSDKTRQLTGLAAGTADTDAVNVAQLKNVNLKYAGDTGNSDVLLKDGTLKVKGDNNFISTSADGTGITVTAKIGNPITANTAGKAEAPTTNGLATTTNVADAINASGWNVVSSNNGGSVTGTQATKLVNPGNTVTLSAGKNIVLDQNDKQFTYSLNKDVDLTKDGSLTIGDTKINNAGMTITGGPSITKTGIDAGSKKITNVTAGTADTDAVNVKQLKDTEKHIKPDTYAVANDGSVTLKYVDGNGAEQTETAKITGIAKKSKVINGQNTTVEEGTDTTDNSVTYKVNVKGDLADISSITNGTGSGKISFEGDQVVKVGGDHPISFDGKGGYVTGLQNKDWDITNPTVVSGRAATEDQLKKVSDGFNNTVKLTGNSGATGTQKLNQNGGLSFGVVGADNGKYITTTASGSNVVADLSTDAKNKLNSKVVVTGSGAATVAAPTVTTNPDGSTVTTYTVHVDPATATAASTESVVKKAVTGDTNIADVSVADGKATGDVGAKYEVSVSRNAVKDAAREAVTVNNGGTTTGGTYTADTNNPITVNPVKDDTNHNTTYEVKFDGNKAAKVIPLTYKANGNGAKTVTLEKGLDFTNGTNTTAVIDNDGVVKYNLNKDVDLSNTGSLTVGGTKVNNGGVTITAPTGGTTTDVKLTNTGLDNGGNKIINVAPGTLSSTSTDAVNGSQLYTVDQKFNNKINLGADGNTETTKLALDNAGGIKFNIKGDGSGASSANQYISTTASGSDIKVDLTQDAKDKLNKTYNVTSSNNSVAINTTTANGVTTFDLQVAPATGTTSTWDIKSSADTANGGATATGHETAAKTIANAKTVEMIAGKNLTVKQTSNTNGAKVEFALSDEIAVGKDGVNGIDGKIGVNGKDGASVVIDGKDGSIGLTGAPGTPGAPGASATLKVKDGVPGVDGAPGTNLTRIVYTDKNNVEHEVATHDDGMKFAGDDGQTNQATNANVIKKHLNNVVDIIGGATKADLTTNNIGVNNDGNGKLLVQLSKNLNGINTIKNGGTTITLNDTPGGTNNTPAVTISGGNLSMGDGTHNNKIVNVAPGTDDSDAVNYKQLKDAKTVLADGKNTKKSGTGTAADPYKVNVEGDLTEITSITNKADASGNAGKIAFSPNQTVTVNGDHNISLNGKTGDITGLTNTTLGGADFATKGRAATEEQLKSVHDTLKANERHIAPTTVATGSTENKGGTANAGGTANVYKYDAASKTVTLTYNDGNGNAVTDTKAVIDLSNLSTGGTGASSWNVKSSANTTDGGAVDANHNANAQNIADGKSVEFQSGKNLVVKQTNDTANGNATVEFSLSDKITVGKDGANGKDGSVGAKGADGSAVVMNGADGSIGLNGTNGANGISIKGKDGANGVGIDGKDGVTRIVYTEKVPDPANPSTTKEVTHEVATMDDGLKFTGNNTGTVNKHKLGSLVKVQGEGVSAADEAAFVSASGNIAVTAENNDTLTIRLNKNLKGLNSIQLGGNTIQSNGDNITFTTNGGTTKTVATTDQLWTIQANGTDVPATNGKVNVVGKDGITVAKNAAGNLEISGAGLGTMNGFDVTANNGATSKTIDNGKKVDFNAGSNLTVKQTNDATGTHIEYALKEAVDLGTNGSLKTGDTTVNKDGVTIANGPSITKTGVDAGDKKITNVADGAVNATSKDAVNGSQLKKYTDAAKTTVEAGDNNVKVETDNSAADGHTNYKVSLEPVVTIGDTHKVKIDGHTGDITGLTNVTLTDPTFATKGRAATEEQLDKVLTEAKKKAVEKVQAGTAAAGDTNIATVTPKAGDTFGAAGATYEVSVSKNAVKDAAKEAVKVTSVSPAITVTPDTSVAHETTYKVGFDGNQAATQIPLTYKQNGGSARTVKLSDGLNFIDGTNTKARTAADGKVTFDVMGDLTGITSISNAAGGPKMTFGGSSINVTNGDLNMGGNKITKLATGTAKDDAATVGQLTKVTSNNHSVVINKTTDADGAPVYDLAVTGTPGAPAADPRVDMLGEEIGRVGAQGAALSALKPIQYDPLEPTQIMAGYGNYRGNSAVALGVAHYKNESTLIHGGVSWAGGSSHMMANAGVTWKVGNRDSEAAVADRYRKGPISSAYAMQQEMAAMKAQNAGLKGEVSDLKAENEQMKAQIAAMMAKLGL